MTKQTEISTITLKNASVDTSAAVIDLVLAEINRRPHLKNGLVDLRVQGRNALHIQVKDEGVMLHVANALSLPTAIEQVMRLIGKAYGRTGKVGTVDVTVWYIEH